MTLDDPLIVLVIVMLAVGTGLSVIASAALGRAITGLELQQNRGVDGPPLIQSWINIRVHGNRLACGMAFAGIALLSLTDTPALIRAWVDGGLLVVLLLSLTVSEGLDWLAGKAQLRYLILQQGDDIQSYRQIADEAIANLEVAARVAVERDARVVIPPLAAVLPEHASPTTTQQRETAHIATQRARLVAANLALGMPPPTDPEKPA